MGVDRRQFLQSGACALAGLGSGLGVRPARAQGMVSRPGEVLRFDRADVCAGPDRVDLARARRLLDDALVAFTGAADPVEALARYVQPEDRVALKVNALAAPGHPFLPGLADHLAELVQLIGVPPDRVVIYDQYPERMRRSGYRFVDRPGSVRCVHHAMRGYVEREVPYIDGRRTLRWCAVLEDASVVLNLMVPKDHDLTGVTGALKNMAFGNLDYVREFHRGIHHAIPWIYGQPEIRDKTRLTICDATRITYEGGPQDLSRTRRAPLGAMLIAEDPVAMDWAVLEMVNAERARRGLERIERRARVDRRPLFLTRAARMGLGADARGLRMTRVGVDGRARPWIAGHIDPKLLVPPT